MRIRFVKLGVYKGKRIEGQELKDCQLVIEVPKNYEAEEVVTTGKTSTVFFADGSYYAVESEAVEIIEYVPYTPSPSSCCKK